MVTAPTSYERLVAEYLVSIATAKSVGETSRCIIFGGFHPAVVSETVARLRAEDPSATIKVDPEYARSSEGSFPLDVVLDRSNESFTTFRNNRRGLSVLFPATLRGEERESTASVFTVEPEDVRYAVAELLDLIPGARERFGPEYAGLRQFLQLLANVAHPSLEELVTYTLTVCELRAEGETTRLALGLALPCFGAFRWKRAFRSCNLERSMPARWHNAIEKAVVYSQNYAMKQAPNGTPLPVEDLLENLEAAGDNIEPANRQILEDFVRAPISCEEKKARALALDWKEDRVELLFKRSSRRRLKLGAATIEHLRATLSGAELLDEEIRLLEAIDSQPTTFEDERERLIELYTKYRAEISKSKRLANRWERELYPKDVEDADFLLALTKTAGQLLVDDYTSNTDDELILKVWPDTSVQQLLEIANRDALLYFLTRYRGVEELLGPSVVFALGPLYQVLQYDEQEADVPDFLRSHLRDFRGYRQSKSANRISFKVGLATRNKAGEIEDIGGAIRVFTWVFETKSFLCGLRDDMRAHLRHPLASYRVPRSLVTSKGTPPPISLREPGCLENSSERGYGRLVPVAGGGEILDAEQIVMERLEELKNSGLISDSVYDETLSVVERVRTLVREGLEAFLNQGLAWNGWRRLAEGYSQCLQQLWELSPGLLFTRKILQPLANIGLVQIDDPQSPPVICGPLHPLRLVALYAKSHQLAGEIKSRVDMTSEFIDSGLHDATLDLDSAHPYYPEFVVWDNVVLTEVSSLGEYSLLRDCKQTGAHDAVDDPAGAARVLEGIVADYLRLHPHEKANLSVLLHTVSSGEFPEEVIDRFSSSYSSEIAEAKCRLVLEDPDRSRLQRQYRSFVSSMDSRTTDGHPLFLSRFRVAAAEDISTMEGIEAGDMDIGFLLDEVSRQAEVRWKRVSLDDAPDIASHYPARWSRREPTNPHATHSGVYLCCPVNPRPIAIYYGVLGSLFADVPSLSLVPIRVVEYDSSGVKKVLGEAHRAARWVINYDGLLSRHHLRQHLNVDVVRYRPSREQDRNLIVSSEKPSYLLNAHLLIRVRQFGLGGSGGWDHLIRTLTRKANDLSGNLILKAAGRGVFTNELLGAVLSAELLRLRLPQPCRAQAVFVYLDDFGSLFSHRATLAGDMGREGSRLADILCIAPLDSSSASEVLLLVSEAKFLSGPENLEASARNSREQLLTTLRKFRSIEDGGMVDRPTWLSILANIVLDSGQSTANFDPEALAWKIRNGRTRLLIEGHSHVFVADREDGVEWSRLDEDISVWQAVMGRAEIAQLLGQLVKPEAPVGDFFVELPPLLASAPRTQPKAGQILSVGEAEAAAAQHSRVVSTDAHERDHGDARKPAAQPSQAGPGEQESNEQDSFSWADRGLACGLSAIKDPLVTVESEEELARQLREVEQKVRDFLPSYDISTKLGESSITPNAWRIRIKGQVGVDPARIDKLRDQFKTVKGLDLIRVEAETGYIALSFKREQRGPVSYLECLRDREVNGRYSNSLILLGRREDNGNLLYYDLRGADTHALIGGMSNSGKTQLLSTMILDLMLTNSPDHLRLVLIDPKKVEFIRFKGVPHLGDRPIVTAMGEAKALLDNLVAEMEERYNLLAREEVNELSKYNSVPGVDPIPRLVVVFDEFADWMLDEDFKRAVNESFLRLAGKARAAGIHLILSTQRPDNTVVSPILRANLGAKIALRVDKKANSEIILDEPGAERLLGRGHGLARLGGERVLFQAAYVPDEVQTELVDLICRYWSRQARP